MLDNNNNNQNNSNRDANGPSWGTLVGGVVLGGLLIEAGMIVGRQEAQAAAPVPVPAASARDSFAVEKEKEYPFKAGQVLPDVELQGPDGKLVKLSEIGKDKLVLVKFWGPWCGACRSELPNVAKIMKELDNCVIVDPKSGAKIAQDFEVYAASVNFQPSHESSWRAMLNQPGLKGAHNVQAKDSEVIKSLTDTFHISGYPTSFLIDGSGRIIEGSGVDAGNWAVESIPSILRIKGYLK